jgi:hypothetical protein
MIVGWHIQALGDQISEDFFEIFHPLSPRPSLGPVDLIVDATTVKDLRQQLLT